MLMTKGPYLKKDVFLFAGEALLLRFDMFSIRERSEIKVLQLLFLHLNPHVPSVLRILGLFECIGKSFVIQLSVWLGDTKRRIIG